MVNLLVLQRQNKMNRIYRKPNDSIYGNRLLEDLSSGYSFILGEKKVGNDFLTFEPSNCYLERLLIEKYHYNQSYYIEKLISSITYSLIAFGKAYVYITPNHMNHDKRNKGKKLQSLELTEIKGFIRRRKQTSFRFCNMELNNDIKEIEIQRNQLIEFDIRGSGYTKRFFKKVFKSLSKCDKTRPSGSLLNNSPRGYDFSVHSRKNKLQVLKALKNFGLSFVLDGLSDSYILYKKIQEDKIRISFLNYILKELNRGLAVFIDDNEGKIVANIKEKNYEELWSKYNEGSITGTELTDILY